MPAIEVHSQMTILNYHYCQVPRQVHNTLQQYIEMEGIRYVSLETQLSFLKTS